MSRTLIDAPDEAASAGEVSGAPGYHVAMPAVGAMIGAMAAAWSIQAKGLETMPRVERAPSVAVAAEVRDVHVAAERPRISAAPAPAAVREVRVAAAAKAPAAAPAAPSARPTPKAQERQKKPDAVTRAQAQAPLRAPAAPAASVKAKTEAKPKAETETKIDRRGAAVLRPSGRMGVLRVNSRPWSTVYVDGRLAGTTPQTALTVAPGRHQIVLINPQFELKRTLSVDVRAGRTVTRTVELLQ